MKKNINKISFNAGQLSKQLNARIDVNKYDNGFQEGLNVQADPRGPVKRRNGSKMIAPTKYPSKTITLVKFQFAQDDAFQLEVGDQYIRFFKNDAIVLNTGIAISGITKANPGVVTATAHGFSNGDQVYITGIVGMTQLNDHATPYVVANKTTNGFDLHDYSGNTVDTSNYTTYSSAGTVAKPYEITTNYLEADLPSLNYTQFGDLIYLVHPSYPPSILTRMGDINWTLTFEVFSPPPTYVSGYKPATTLTPAATSGTGINFTAGTSLWLQGDVGRQIINTTTGEVGTAVITSITSGTVAIADILTNFSNTTAKTSGNWHLDASPIGELTFSGTIAGSTVTIDAAYPTGAKGVKKVINAITTANPSVITTASPHGYIAGTKVFINDVVGMTEINGRTLTAYQVGTSTLTLTDGSGTTFNATVFGAYSSGGTVQQVYTGISQDTFRSVDIGKYIVANDGVIQITSITNAQEAKGVILKSLTSASFTNNWTLEEPTWNSTRGYPRSVGFIQQRIVYGGYEAQPLELNFSEVGVFDGFGRGSGDTDAIQVDISADQVNQINWIANTKQLIIGTSGSEITVDAPSASSGLSASNIRQTPTSACGSKTQHPIKIGSEVVYIQNAGRKLNSFKYDFNSDTYDSEDLTFISDDITSGILKEVAYAQEPNSVIYAVTLDGSLLTCVYNEKQEVIAWSKYLTDGLYENVQTISEDNRDKVYVVVNRTINGATRRYIEVFDNGTGESDLDGFSDSYLTYNEPLVVTSVTKANPAVVTSTAHGLSNGDRVKFINVSGMGQIENISYLVANKTSDTFELNTLQGAAIDSTTYSTFVSGEVHKLFNTLTGLDHLEGKSVEVKANNALATATGVVTNGSITLDDYYYAFTVGLPYTGRITLLPLSIDIGLGPSRGIQVRYINPILELLSSSLPVVNGQYLASRNTQDLMDNSVPLFSGYASYGNLDWDNTGSISIVMEGPFPCNLLGIFGTAETNDK